MWISRRDYDEALREARHEGAQAHNRLVAALSDQLAAASARGDRLAEALVRIARHEHGMPEVEAVQRKPPRELTPELKGYVRQFSGPFQEQAATSVQVRLDRGEDPDDILRDLTGA